MNMYFSRKGRQEEGKGSKGWQEESRTKEEVNNHLNKKTQGVPQIYP